MEEREVRAGTIACALAPWGESGVRVRKKADVAGYSEVRHWHQPNMKPMTRYASVVATATKGVKPMSWSTSCYLCSFFFLWTPIHSWNYFDNVVHQSLCFFTPCYVAFDVLYHIT